MDAIVANLPYMLRGLQLTFLLSIATLVGSLIGGTVFALMRMSPWWWLRWPAILYIDLVRMTPFIMVIFWVFFLIPILVGYSVNPITAALIALIGFTTSYMAEVIRAGIQTVPSGLLEAARSSGLGFVQAMSHVVLPIAFRNILPTLINRFVAIIMGTSLAYIIGVTEFFRAANDINNKVFRPYEIYTFVAIVYFVCCFALSLLGRFVAQKLAHGDQRIGSERITSD